METDYLLFFVSQITFYPFSVGIIVGLLFIVLLLFSSALISGSEVAYFALNPKQIQFLTEENTRNSRLVLELLDKPQRLLATILITNNFINIAIVILSAFVMDSIVDFSNNVLVGFLMQVVIITFLLLLFGEIIPKVFANARSLKFALFMGSPLFVLQKIFRPLSSFLVFASSSVNKHFRRNTNLSDDEWTSAINLAVGEEHNEEKRILQGIVNYRTIDASEIMHPRVDVVAIERTTEFREVLRLIRSESYSRIPIYDETFDHITGILVVKDLLPYLDEQEYDWIKLIRKPYFVPEAKKINDLLEEFKVKKIHMAIVTDEYGGTSGIVTLEDILEEIVGDIMDETDGDEKLYRKIAANIFIFEGKILLNDFLKVINISDDDKLEKIKGEAETLAGLLLEIKGDFPIKGENLVYENISFIVESVDNRRIIEIRVIIK